MNLKGISRWLLAGCLVFAFTACSYEPDVIGPTPGDLSPRCERLFTTFEEAKTAYEAARGTDREADLQKAMKQAQSGVFSSGCAAS